MSDIINKWKNGLEKTRKATFGQISTLLGTTELTNEFWDDLEAVLFQADIGFETTKSILDEIRKKSSSKGLTKTEQLKSLLQMELLSRLDIPSENAYAIKQLSVILIVGVNGSGKTTTIAKLGKYFLLQNKKVLFGAADTYRAAAVDQLKSWAERLGIPIIAGQDNSDPGAVAYDTVKSAIAKNYDVVIIDTAGRLHTRYNLMEEIKKVHRVVGKALPGAPHASWLVLDATTGQNALQQARAFKAAVDIDGIILAKLDTSAKGGMAFAIQNELGVPILFAGLGEKPEDLQIFDPNAFVNGILSIS